MKKLFISRNSYGFVALTHENSTTQNVIWVDTETGKTHEDSQSSLWRQENYMDGGYIKTDHYHQGWQQLTPENIAQLGENINCAEKVCYLSQEQGLVVQKVIQSLLKSI